MNLGREKPGMMDYSPFRNMNSRSVSPIERFEDKEF